MVFWGLLNKPIARSIYKYVYSLGLTTLGLSLLSLVSVYSWDDFPFQFIFFSVVGCQFLERQTKKVREISGISYYRGNVFRFKFSRARKIEGSKILSRWKTSNSKKTCYITITRLLYHKIGETINGIWKLIRLGAAICFKFQESSRQFWRDMGLLSVTIFHSSLIIYLNICIIFRADLSQRSAAV